MKIRRDLSDSRDRWFIAAVVALAAVYLGVFLFLVWATIIRTPVLDMVTFVRDYLGFRSSGNFWAYLWSNHNEHRLVWTRLVTAADIALFHGVMYPFVASATACLIAVALLMGREAANAVTWPGAKVAGALLAIMLFLTAANAVDCSLPTENIYPHTLFFAALSLILANGGAFSGGWGVLRMGATLLAAIAAAFGCAVGLVIWPILLWTAWRRALGWPWLLAIAGVGAVFVALYTQDLPMSKDTVAAVGGEGQFYAPAHLYKAAIYVVTYMGLPWTRSSALAPLGRVIGASLLAVGLFLVVRRGIIRPPASRVERLSLALIMFTLATAALAVLGRVDADPGEQAQVPVRYAAFLAPLHVGLLLLLLPWLDRLRGDPIYRRICKTAVLLLFAFLPAQQVLAGRAALQTTDAVRTAIRKFRAGEPLPQEMLRFLGGTPDRAQEFETLLKENGIYSADD